MLLIKHREAYVSGQIIADSLKVSRAAVWKAVEALRAEGYLIDSIKSKGYRLASVPDILGEREVRLGFKARRLGKKIYCLSETDSTNTFASRLAAQGEPDGTVVLSEYQSAGRGRLGRKWISPPGVNIYMSVILRPEIPPDEAPLATLMAAVALAKAVRGLYELDARIKWPNDLLIGGKKAAGILTEMSAEPERVRHIIIGIGIDVNMPAGEFPEELRGISTSVKLELGRESNRAELVRRLIAELEGGYADLRAGRRGNITAQWKELSCTLGRMVRINTLRGERYGFAEDITEDGGLVLTQDGEREVITSGDVSFI
ncbi:MAG TPA: biotin--[acetyl-CoA-carboxylase] ligase [Nitrospirota bacterium]